ncbi:sulfurtransferase TusA family protein [Halocalculus aciditolerans]|uniref:UPF0033 domain-containing protein n=1 Tax=Halocalculus aciditolerans TaxID=1383812 RepID=A0A830F5E7_9EURY|nr:sulfurtransferase TusA family protein [Halocalculus aciditolerans]GGL64651.1 hypothetical protein GCM10009039_23290 [Halocalculus aciditolerans]
MTFEDTPTETLDAKGLNCPMPVVEAKRAVDDLDDGDVLEVVATDPGSVNDVAGWADNTPGVELEAQDEDETGGDTSSSDEPTRTIYTHYVRKTE